MIYRLHITKEPQPPQLLGSFVADKGIRGDWIWQIHRRAGAGYIGGWTLWFGYCFPSPWHAMYGKRMRWTAGITRNANRVPLIYHWQEAHNERDNRK